MPDESGPDEPQLERISWEDIEAGDVAFFMMEHLASQRRIYDALLALLAVKNPDNAVDLLKQHRRGEYLYPPPWEDDDASS